MKYTGRRWTGGFHECVALSLLSNALRPIGHRELHEYLSLAIDFVYLTPNPKPPSRVLVITSPGRLPFSSSFLSARIATLAHQTQFDRRHLEKNLGEGQT